MQKILDRTQESLALAFATLAQNAKRQQRVYLATIGSLMLVVAIFALVLAVVAGLAQLDYRRTFASQNATDISLLLHQEESFSRRVELTFDYYYTAPHVRSAPEAVQQSIRRTGVVRGKVDRIDAGFDMLVGEATTTAWGPQLGEKLGRLYEASQSTLATQQAFELQQRATLVGLTEDYAVILPSLAQPVAGKAAAAKLSAVPQQQLAFVRTLRETLERQLEAQTGRRLPGKGERVWLGPYLDPLENVPVISAVSVYYDGGTPTTLISMNIRLDVLARRIAPPGDEGTILLMAADRRIIASSKPLGMQTGKMLQQTVAATPSHVFHYGREGVIFHEPLGPGFGFLVGYLPWGALAVALGWQLAVIAALTALILLAVALTARYFGFRLLRNAFAETSRSLESETINHVLVSATPVGLCVVRQGDYSVLTANALAAELLSIEPGGNRLPPHIVGEFLAQTPGKPSAAAIARIAAFVVAARPQSPASAPSEEGAPPARFLQFTYAPARYAGENVLFCAILDVTAQTLLEQQLRHAQQTSDAMMRARTNFFAAMSHEIRTPLNALLGNLELFARTPGLEAHSQRLATLSVASDALRRVVNDILDFSKIDAGEMLLANEPFRPIDEFENIAFSHAPLCGDRAIRFYALLSPTLDCTLIGDRMRIAQVVNNLLSNAFKFTSSGKITLYAEVKDDPQGRPTLLCRISDSGAGMSEELLARLFKPFVQGALGTSRGTGGTGLGLVICARLCELMGGRISAESVPGVGSVFHVSIPLVAVPGDQRTPVAIPASRGTALVLCTERQAGEFLDGWLQRAGWSSHTVMSLAGAEAWLKANRPAVLIVSGEYDLEAIVGLRALQAVGVVWITSGGPTRPEARAQGVLEVSEFSRTACLTAIELAVEGASAAPAEASAAASALTPSVEIDPALLGLAVLVAEDNPLIQNLIAEQLVELGCVPTIAADGKQALALFERAPFEVVLTDVHMPVMDGHELLTALRERHAELPVLAFSAAAEEQQAQSWHERGFNGYVSKPASLSELQAALLAVVPAPARAARAKAASTAESASADSVAPVANVASMLSADDKARYTAMLREHLQKDLPRLLAIVEEEDVRALAGWAHSASGAFVVVQEPEFFDQCRQLQRLCADNSEWTTEMDERAISLHEALSDHYGLDEQPAR
ncbi:response regulator [Paraburkholderia xenovorans LB400]|uniref:Virulence sensor protein BvgS n=1 Tax=Paraburkholderia xenovorans (strain LB400) TaxID=266265 RepID=Q13SC6_PARXL|nr:ATP-binding protein [Paraburkholderia xenovorans]ABE33013.1 Periplasmic sensor hybrid histidine kinase [Paraburkholderia xenovorans LB400]AIP36771.1 response regulator [Paraburkholderia xenovorans LB400]